MSKVSYTEVMGPAIEYNNGDREYWINGLLHRDGGPALEGVATNVWLHKGRLHRSEDKPALTISSLETGGGLGGSSYVGHARKHTKNFPYFYEGDQGWWKMGKIHRDSGPAIIKKDGTKKWYKNGFPHREDGPAVEYPNGSKEWWHNGKLHREDGPAHRSRKRMLSILFM